MRGNCAGNEDAVAAMRGTFTSSDARGPSAHRAPRRSPLPGFRLALGALAALIVPAAPAATLSYSGFLTSDDQVLFLPFSVTGPSDATFRTLSYGGGADANGNSVSPGGFDPVLSLFDAAGNRLEFVDDGTEPDIDPDPTTGLTLDSDFTWSLTPGDYTLTLSQSNNYPGLTLADPFSRQGEGNFTATYGCGAPGYYSSYFDFGCNARTGNYFVEILNVAAVPPPPSPPEPEYCGEGLCEPSPVPIPPAAPMFLSGLLALRFARRRGRSSTIRKPLCRYYPSRSVSGVGRVVAYCLLAGAAMPLSGVVSVAEAQLPQLIAGDNSLCHYHYPSLEEARSATIWAGAHDGAWGTPSILFPPPPHTPGQPFVTHASVKAWADEWVAGLAERFHWNATWVLEECPTQVAFDTCVPRTETIRLACPGTNDVLEGQAYECAGYKSARCTGYDSVVPPPSNRVDMLATAGYNPIGTEVNFYPNNVYVPLIPRPAEPFGTSKGFYWWGGVFVGDTVKCPVEPLKPLEDYIQQYHLNEPDMADLTRELERLAPADAFGGPLSERMNAALACLEGKTSPAPGVTCTTTRASGFRPEAYQAHLHEIVSKWNQLNNKKDGLVKKDPVKYAACVAIGRVKEIDDAKGPKHRLGKVAARPGTSNHGKRPAEAVDLRFDCQRTNANGSVSVPGGMDPLFDDIARQCGVSRIRDAEKRASDPWHFN